MRAVKLASITLAVLTAGARGGGAAAAVDVTRETVQMGTYFRVTVGAATRADGLQQAGRAIAAIEEMEELLSTYRAASEVSRLNRAEVGAWTPMSPRLAAVLASAAEIADESGWAFDPAIGALTAAYGVHASGRTPRAEELALARAATGPRAFLLDPAALRACRLQADSALDTGGFGKGAGLDLAASVLREAGVERALLDLGGQVLAIGGPFEVEIADPDRRTEAVGRVLLRDGSIATSGNGERAQRLRGRAIGHLIDPRRAAPADDLGSVTVLAPGALEADALATALFVLGPRDGLGLVQARAGSEVLFLLRAPGRNGLDGRATPGLRRLLRGAAFALARDGGRS